MDAKELEPMVGKILLLILENEYKYKGTLESINGNTIVFIDRKIDRCLFDASDIRTAIPIKGV